MVVTVITVLIVLAALAAAYYFGPAGWRTSAAGTFGGLGTRVGKFIESGRADPRPGGDPAPPPPHLSPPRFSEADRAYLDGVWKHVQSTFVSNPTSRRDPGAQEPPRASSPHTVSRPRGCRPGRTLPCGDGEAGDAGDAGYATDTHHTQDTETLRRQLLAIKTWSDREAAR